MAGETTALLLRLLGARAAGSANPGLCDLQLAGRDKILSAEDMLRFVLPRSLSVRNNLFAVDGQIAM